MLDFKKRLVERILSKEWIDSLINDTWLYIIIPMYLLCAFTIVLQFFFECLIHRSNLKMINFYIKNCKKIFYLGAFIHFLYFFLDLVLAVILIKNYNLNLLICSTLSSAFFISALFLMLNIQSISERSLNPMNRTISLLVINILYFIYFILSIGVFVSPSLKLIHLYLSRSIELYFLIILYIKYFNFYIFLSTPGKGKSEKRDQ